MLRAHGTIILVFWFGTIGFSADNPVYLQQGWSPDDRQQFYYTTQGSQLLPYEWFLAMEQPGSKDLFRSDSNMNRLRFIPQPPNRNRNPDGLPIGFVKDDNPSTVMITAKRPFLGRQYADENYPRTNAWLGLTCAACHTNRIEYKGAMIHVDGGPALADVEQFLKDLAQALRTTYEDKQAFERFAKLVLRDSGDNSGERDALLAEVEAYSKVLDQLVRRTSGTNPYGFARLDAFGSIFNEICATSLEIPENYFPSDAPASFPFLWDTPRLDWVQSNASASNPMARNVGEALGVFAQLNLRATPSKNQFASTVHFANLFRLEQQVAKLKAPAWPAEQFGSIDRKAADEGKQLFAKNCAGCHAVRDESSGDFPLRDPNPLGHRFIKTVTIPLQKIGTDPALVMNFAVRKAKPGALGLPGEEELPRAELLRRAVGGVIKRQIAEAQPPLSPDQISAINGFRPVDEIPPNLLAYKARPLNGIWATAPYLHNGSVPNLDALLKPAEDRPVSFYVGSRQFNPELVGFDDGPSPDLFEFRVYTADGRPISGNSNSGHEGRHYTQNETDSGEWRDFDVGQRKALIEYMKSLN